jgi:hypothetical protein
MIKAYYTNNILLNKFHSTKLMGPQSLLKEVNKKTHALDHSIILRINAVEDINHSPSF